MAILTVGVVIVGILVLVDLLLTLGLIRRVRSHAGLLDQVLNERHRPTDSQPSEPRAGSELGDFTAVTVDGRSVSRDSLSGGSVLGFFSTWCGACEEHLPGFLEYAAPLDREQVLAVVQGDEPALAGLVAKLAPVAQVVIEPDHGPIFTATGVQGLPTMVVLDDSRRVRSSGFSAAQLTPAHG